MDGNGRWAEAKNLSRAEGHKTGVQTVKTIIQASLEKGIRCLSLFAFSSENWLRPTEEVDFLMQLFVDALEKELAELHARGIRLCFTGDKTQLSPILQERVQKAEILTKSNHQLILNVVINYGGKWDIVNAAKNLAFAVAAGEIQPETINETLFESYLSCADLPEVDMFIRTSGELRISNFFLWQLAYTELYFTDVHWPDFSVESFEMALASYGQRNRRFGRVSVEES